MQILLDTGIFIHSEFAEGAIKQIPARWGGKELVVPVHGLIRKQPSRDLEFERQKEALFTVGRLIREGRLRAYDYYEIRTERVRGGGRRPEFNALRGCQIHKCHPTLVRSKFMQTSNLMDEISKGGKKDRKAGVKPGGANQLAFLKWLCGLRKEHVDVLIQHAAQIRLSPFEVETLNDINWFQFLCQRSGSPENYLDVFHLWTAERNGLDALLTLEKRLPNLVSRVRNERIKRVEIRTQVLRPLDLLKQLGIGKLDPVPMEADRFYHLHEVTE